jgi:hypothetical protein
MFEWQARNRESLHIQNPDAVVVIQVDAVDFMDDVDLQSGSTTCVVNSMFVVPQRGELYHYREAERS